MLEATARGRALKLAEAIEKKVVAAFNRRDAAAILALDAADALYVGVDGKAIRGHAAIEANYLNSFKAWGDFKFSGVTKDAGTIGDGFWGLFEQTIEGTGPNGPFTRRSHVLELYVREGKDWKIAVTSIGADISPPATSAL